MLRPDNDKPSAGAKGRPLHTALLADCAILAIAALMFILLASPAAVVTMAQSRRSPIYRGSSRTQVALQCAVSWDAAALEPMLDVLREEGVCITFAVSGLWASRNPGLLKRIADEGHEVAVMGWDPGQDGDREYLLADLDMAVSAVEEVSGERPTTYYCGSRKPSVSAETGAMLGLDTVLCTLDLDCTGGDPREALDRLTGSVTPGSIILIRPTAVECAALRQMIDYLKNIGFAIVSTHKMLYN